MSYVRDYQKVIGLIYGRCVVHSDLQQNYDDPDTWFELQNDNLNITVTTLKQVLSDLVKRNVIQICSELYFPLSLPEHGPVFDSNEIQLHDHKSILIEFIVLDGTLLKNRLVDLEESIAGNEPELKIIDGLDDYSLEYSPVGNFRIFSSGSVLYQDQPFVCTNYLKLILIIMLRNEGSTTTFDDIRRVLDLNDLEHRKISQMVRGLSKFLIPVLGYDPIISERGVGYLLKL